MIYQYHLDFKDEKVLQTPPPKHNRGIIPVIEDDQMELSGSFPVITEWKLMAGIEARYLSAASFSKESNDVSWGLEVKDVLSLLWSKESGQIFYRKGKEYRPDRLRFWLYHTFFPILLERRGIYHILHVGSVEIAGKAVLFSAPSFGGKSTMTDYFIRRGHTMLSDDAVAIEESGTEYYAIASYPFQRPYRIPEDLGYAVENFSTKTKPLHTVYILNKSDTQSEITLREIKGIEKFKAFHYSSFLMFDFMKAERFRFFTQMAKEIAMYEITYPHDRERLPDVYKKIIQCEERAD